MPLNICRRICPSCSGSSRNMGIASLSRHAIFSRPIHVHRESTAGSLTRKNNSWGLYDTQPHRGTWPRTVTDTMGPIAPVCQRIFARRCCHQRQFCMNCPGKLWDESEFAQADGARKRTARNSRQDRQLVAPSADCGHSFSVPTGEEIQELQDLGLSNSGLLSARGVTDWKSSVTAFISWGHRRAWS